MGRFPLVDDLFLYLSVGVVILLNAIYVMALVFFFWSIYQVFRSRIGLVLDYRDYCLGQHVDLLDGDMSGLRKCSNPVMEMGPMHGPIQTMDLLNV